LKFPSFPSLEEVCLGFISLLKNFLKDGNIKLAMLINPKMRSRIMPIYENDFSLKVLKINAWTNVTRTQTITNK
jgi:hypothetical protein